MSRSILAHSGAGLRGRDAEDTLAEDMHTALRVEHHEVALVAFGQGQALVGKRSRKRPAAVRMVPAIPDRFPHLADIDPQAASLLDLVAARRHDGRVALVLHGG